MKRWEDYKCNKRWVIKVMKNPGRDGMEGGCMVAGHRGFRSMAWHTCIWHICTSTKSM